MTKRLQAIIAVSALMLTAACAAASPPASPSGLVTGKFVIVGGPGGQQSVERPLSGTIQFTASGRHPVTTRAGSSGTFSVTLRPGTYHVSGTSPRMTEVSSNGTSRQSPCFQPYSVAVTSQHTTTITLTCDVP